MSAVEVTEDDLHLLEDEVQNDRAPSRRSQDSGASVEPVDPHQVIESEAAENVVNNNSSDALETSDVNLDNPFDIPTGVQTQTNAARPENPCPQSQTEDAAASESSDTVAADPDVALDEAPQKTPQSDSPAPEQDAAVNSDDADQGAVGGGPEAVVAPSEEVLGKVRPMWIHDEDAPICMNCGQDFTMFRRRHHCRACGKVLCGNCCKDRARLQFMDGELARVCSYCIEILNRVERWSRPDPSNPMEYCSTVSPLAQMSSTAQLPPPTVMVPVGVLKKGGEKSNTAGNGLGGSSGCSKSVTFSDGIRPGGDLTDLDIPSTPPAQRTPQRTLKQLTTGRSKAVVARKYRKYVSVTDSLGCLPNVLLSNKFKPYDQPLTAGTLFNLLQDPTLPPVSFELTRHKVQLRVKIVTLDCCLGSRVWSFCSEGLAAFGQEEVAFILEYHADDELAVPRDVLKLYKILYENACRGAPVIQMDHLLFPGGLLGSNEHAGILFLRTSLQCTQNILKPLHENNYLVAMLIMRSEVPWAKLFPLRLLLRLGAESRYYPCPLVSQRFRKAVYFDGDQHSIMSILADFRNYQYTIQNIPGLVIHVVGKTYTIKAPRNRYDLMMKASTTNENILAIGSNFSSAADSHLVCIQGEDGSFQSQTINIASLPVKVTGASFLVFSGALKSNSGYTAKSSIVEDGILVQIGPQDMAKLKQAIHAMENYRIVCKETKINQFHDRSLTQPAAGTAEPAEEEYVELQWVENEVTRNESVISVVDGSCMAGIPSCKIFSGTDYSNDKFVVRWTELFFLASKDTELDLPDPNRLIEATARSMCVALLPHAAKLYERDLKKVALRISLDPEQFGYELGAGGEPLNGEFLAEVDSALVPIITSLDGSHQPMTIELVFYVLLK
ncbi:zinc finger FYVE domain-containing protein 9 [Galendromus occidentalis]|uniref:Zinc finger FYVE domain-containing protein 9 n=1 Tax=Galendromus occidentalis TaxID=34638 RepID=A0AAJ7SEB5_9ACAR|nr:zinc finger FYVE domain-containing protein 9 [Galendromus occidentalis]